MFIVCTFVLFFLFVFFKITFSVYVRESFMEENGVFVLTITRCSCSRPRFGLQHPYGGSHPSLSPFPTDLMPAFGLHGYQAHTCIYAPICMLAKHT